MKVLTGMVIGWLLVGCTPVLLQAQAVDTTGIRQAIRVAFAADPAEKNAREIADRASFDRDYRNCTGPANRPVCSIAGGSPVYFVGSIEVTQSGLVAVRIVKFTQVNSGNGLAKTETPWLVKLVNGRWTATRDKRGQITSS